MVTKFLQRSAMVLALTVLTVPADMGFSRRRGPMESYSGFRSRCGRLRLVLQMRILCPASGLDMALLLAMCAK